MAEQTQNLYGSIVSTVPIPTLIPSVVLTSPYVPASGSIHVSVAPTPITGTFSLTILNAQTGAVYLIFRVTSVTGGGLILNGASEGLDNAAPLGAAVVGTMITVAAINQLKQDIISPIEPANLFLAGPTGGAPTNATFRAIIAADLPNTAVVSGPYTLADITIDPQGRITSAASGTPANFGAQGSHAVLAGPTPSFRTLVAADLPNTAVAPAAYKLADITIDAQGRITSAASGTPADFGNEPANNILAGPTSGAPAPPLFRVMTFDDLPTNGVTPGTYILPTLTVTTKGTISVIANGGGTPPNPANFAWTNQGGATNATNSDGSSFLVGTNQAGDSLRVWRTAIAATPVSYVVGILPIIAGSTLVGFGFTDGTKYEFICIVLTEAALDTVSVAVKQFDTVTAGHANVALLNFVSPGKLYFKIRNDGTTISFFVGNRADNLVQIYSELKGAYLGTITQVGYILDGNGTTAGSFNALTAVDFIQGV